MNWYTVRINAKDLPEKYDSRFDAEYAADSMDEATCGNTLFVMEHMAGCIPGVASEREVGCGGWRR